MLCRFIAVALIMLPFQTAQASLIGTDQALSPASVQADRDLLAGFLGRSQVAAELQAFGVDVQVARDRVAAMTDEEVRSLAGQVETAPAGGVIVLILVIFLVWFVAFRR